MRSPRTDVVGAALAILLLVFAAAPGAGQPAPDQSPPLVVRSAAQAGLRAMLGAGSGAAIQRLGFPDAVAAAGATIQDGFRTYTVPPERLVESGAADLRSLAVPTSLWQLTVADGRSARALVTVDRVRGEWTAVSLGASGLAEQLAMLLERWPLSSYRVRFIRVYQASADLMEIARDGNVIGFVPFLSARIALGASGPFDPGDLWSGEEMVARLRPVVRTAIGRL